MGRDQSMHVLELLASQVGCQPDDICDFELQACDTQPSIVAGAMKEFIFSGRLDNLCMSFCSLKALIDATYSESSLEDETAVSMVALFDHEEVGSNSAQGAGSPAMLNALSRITNSFGSDPKYCGGGKGKGGSRSGGWWQWQRLWRWLAVVVVVVAGLMSVTEVGVVMATVLVATMIVVMSTAIGYCGDRGGNNNSGGNMKSNGDGGIRMLIEKAIQRSFLVSADMAHALHPNYMDKHEDNHQPKLHGGLVIKHNANQRYATNSVTSFIFKEIATKHNLPIQDFVVRNDMACGSTIGPILASGVGIRTVDVGAPQLSMHSIREMCAVDDVKHSYEHFKAYFKELSHLDAKITVDI